MVDTLPATAGTKTLADSRTPSRILTVARTDLVDWTAGPPNAAQQIRIKHETRTKGPNTAFRWTPPDGIPECARPPAGRLHGTPQKLMLAKSCGAVGCLAPPPPAQCGCRR